MTIRMRVKEDVCMTFLRFRKIIDAFTDTSRAWYRKHYFFYAILMLLYIDKPLESMFQNIHRYFILIQGNMLIGCVVER